MKVLAIDPGNEQSAFVVWDGFEVEDKGIIPNDELLEICPKFLADIVLIERMESYGMPVGATVFETCIWIGRFIQKIISTVTVDDKVLLKNPQIATVPRILIKMHHCKNTRAKDSNIRAALIEKYGATGTKKIPNPIYNDSTEKMSKDKWSAFAIATWYSETHADFFYSIANQPSGDFIPLHDTSNDNKLYLFTEL